MSPTRLVLPVAIGLTGLGLALACAAPTTAAVIGGTPEDDRLFGTAEADMIRGKGGDDLLVGRAGGDTLKGSSGADVMYGHRGSDYFVPGNGRDLVYGGRGDDTVEFWSDVGSGTGPDKGADQVRLGTGNDIVHAFPDGNADVHFCGEGFDRVYYNVYNTGEPEAFDRFFNCEKIIEVMYEDRLDEAP